MKTYKGYLSEIKTPADIEKVISRITNRIIFYRGKAKNAVLLKDKLKNKEKENHYLLILREFRVNYFKIEDMLDNQKQD